MSNLDASKDTELVLNSSWQFTGTCNWHSRETRSSAKLARPSPPEEGLAAHLGRCIPAQTSIKLNAGVVGRRKSTWCALYVYVLNWSTYCTTAGNDTRFGCENRSCTLHGHCTLQSIAVAFEHCVLRGLSWKLCSANMTVTQSVCMASRLLRIQGRAISVKLHPQKVLAAHGHAMRNVQTQLQSTVFYCRSTMLWIN